MRDVGQRIAEVERTRGVGMFDGRAIADAVLGEIEQLARAVSFADAPNLDHSQKVARMLRAARVPIAEILGQIIVEVFWASMLTEEGRPCLPRLLLDDSDSSGSTHRFRNPVPLTRENLRRLAPVQGPTGYIVWSPDAGSIRIVGVQAHIGGLPHGLIVRAIGAGAMDATFWSHRLVALRGGSLRVASTWRLPTSTAALQALEGVLGASELIFAGGILAAVAEAGHGGSLWIIADGASLAGLTIGHIVDDEVPVLDRYPKFESRLPWLRSIAGLAAVDGAVVLDARLRVRGFGAFVKLGQQVPVLRQLPDGSSETTNAEAIGGGRHRSAVDFCRQFAPAAALVVSQDGKATVFLAEGRETLVECAELDTFGFADI